MIAKFDSNIEKDTFNYFFTFLSDRFEPLNNIWAQELEKKFNKKFKPISVLPFMHNQLFEEENYIVLNKRLFELQRRLNNENIINLIYPEDLNQQFSESSDVKILIQKLIKKQGKLFILGFSSVWLNSDIPNVIILGPDPKVAEFFDNKINHINLFTKLNLPINTATVYENFDELINSVQFPIFLSAEYSSGGFESKLIDTKEELENFYATLRPINKKGKFIASSPLRDIELAPNTSAIITDKNKTTVICISDQLLRENRYMGNLYPSQTNLTHKKLILDSTITVGNYLSEKGFRGIFGCDFLITKQGDCFITDINPRRQGGYLCNILMSKKINLIEMELRLALKEKVPDLNYESFQVDYSWGHSKLTPYFPNANILSEFENGDPLEPFENIGKTYQAIYYSKDYAMIAGNPGFYLTTDNSYKIMKERLLADTEKLISTNYVPEASS